MLTLTALLLSTFSVKPILLTDPVGTDADDPAFYVNRKNRASSLILGTDKSKAPEGGLYAFNLKGKTVQVISNIDRPNNVDVAYDLKAGKQQFDIAVLTERFKKKLRVFRINPNSKLPLEDITGNTPVFVGETGEDAAPMGIALGEIAGKHYAYVTPKAGPLKKHVAQYQLIFNPTSKKVDIKLVRRFGLYSGKKETESIAFDPFHKTVYYSDETVGTRKYDARPNAADKELAFFNRTGTVGDHEGIAIWPSDKKGNGWIVCTDQIDANSNYRVFDRKSLKLVGMFSGGADQTDGIDINAELGLMAAMNSGPKNFLVYKLTDIRRNLKKNGNQH